MQKLFMGLLGALVGAGSLWGGNEAAGSEWAKKAAEWSFETAAEHVPFLKQIQNTWFGRFIQENWTGVAGALVAYTMAPKSLQPIVGLLGLGLVAWLALKGKAAGAFNSNANPNQPVPAQNYGFNADETKKLLDTTASGLKTVPAAFTGSAGGAVAQSVAQPVVLPASITRLLDPKTPRVAGLEVGGSVYEPVAQDLMDRILIEAANGQPDLIRKASLEVFPPGVTPDRIRRAVNVSGTLEGAYGARERELIGAGAGPFVPREVARKAEHDFDPNQPRPELEES